MTRIAASLLVAVLGLAGCGPVAEQASPAAPSAPASSAPDPAPSMSASPAPSAPSGGQTLTGTLAGDGQLEGGCVWIETADGSVEPALPDGYTTSTAPVAVIGPDGQPVAEEGERITVVGEPAPDMMTTCQVGAVWRVSAIKPAG